MKLRLKSITPILTLAISLIVISTAFAMEKESKEEASAAPEGSSFGANSAPRHPPLPADTIIVGCHGPASMTLGSMGVMENGWHVTQWIRQGMGKHRDIHNHARHTTLDLEPQHPSLTNPHVQEDWFSFQPQNGYGCVVLEKLDPVGPLPINIHPGTVCPRLSFPGTTFPGTIFHPLEEGDPNLDLRFMPKAIEKSRQILNPGGRLVINLALDILFHSQASAEDLEKFRTENPFCGRFNETLQISLKQALALYRSDKAADKEVFQQRGGLAYEAIRFYNQQMGVALAETLRTNASAGPAVIVTPKQAEDMFRNEYDLSSIFSWALIRKPEDHPAYDALLRICFVLKQKNLMVQYLNQHGFESARVEWLAFDEHLYNKRAGFFVTATAAGGAL